MIIDMESRGLKGDREQDATLAVFEALRDCRDRPGAKLVFPQGRYHFRPELAVERHLYITNHDQGGTRKIAFPLTGHSGLTIDGQGSEFVFHGSIIPFAIDRCEGIELKRFSIDWERPMFDQGTVVEKGEDSFDVRLREGTAYEVKDGKLYFAYDGGWLPVWGLHDIDPATMAHAYQSGDRISWSSFKKLRIDEIGRGLVRVSGHPRHVPAVGNRIGMRFGRREHPGFFLQNSSDIRIEQVAVHHAPGMALVAQRCADIRLREFDVRLKPGSDRVFTATADATHFTNCRGSITMERCLFENQLDDPCNVHGIYSRIERRPADDALLVKLMEPMTKGVAIAEPGDRLNVVASDSLLAYGSATVAGAERINADYQLIRFRERLPEQLRIGDVVENATWNPDLTVRHCTVRANRARGFLITTPGKVLLEHNTISAPGSAVKISGDASSWFESGAVRDVTIRDNLFLSSNYCCPDWGKAVIDIDPEIADPEAYGECYHRNIRIENNRFETFDIGLVYGHSVDGFAFRGNRIVRTRDYPMHGYMKHAIQMKAVRNADVSGNEAPPEYDSVLLGGTVYSLAEGVRLDGAGDE
ncbi:alpha-1,3-galactosidase-related protein [Paenibacillus sp. GYB003]|uniref:alpha-1,3-galactosidase-related protein n=1 Tax=Paenibacillus sp. GYB003 TaxID=2994392 RepID=UPI002F963A14